ncbi:interleukin-15 receptor subunit alpha isoform X3 [Acipenser ruthenus]|uniref:interleukin-15 receptor subunit alpha isoform X3 n=1 Tax=Acipenser ruthenus TaxID=7906 RepID=UPI00145B296B|nr:interleukin-15 receptor subunit alpha isoform X3 [Acipenser ruthenus]
MNYRPVAFLLIFSFSYYTEHDTVWAADKNSTDKCEHPVRLKFTNEFEEHSFLVGHSYRYNCIPGYKRKAGTSSLIRCMNESGKVQWSEAKITCIRDPKLKGATDPPQVNKGSTAETAASTELSTITVPYVSTAEASSSSASPPALTTLMPVPSTSRPPQHTTADITAGIVETTDRERTPQASASPSPTSPTTQYRVSSTEPIVTYNIPDITEKSTDISVGAKAGGSIAAVLLFIIITAIVICIYKMKWGRNIIVTPASELQPMTNPEQPPPDVMLISNVPVTENGDTDEQ